MKNLMKTDIEKMEIRMEMCSKIIKWKIWLSFLLLGYGALFGQSGEYHVKKELKLTSGNIVEIREDSSFIITGNLGLTGPGSYNTLPITLVDKQGNIIWNKIVDSIFYRDYLVSILPTRDRGFILGFRIKELINSNNPYNDNFGDESNLNIGLLKIDSLGNFQWKKKIGVDSSGTDQNDVVYSILQDSKENYYVISYSNSAKIGMKTALNKGNMDVWVVKLNNNGNILWDRTYGGISGEYVMYSILENDKLSIFSHSHSDSSINKIAVNSISNELWIIQLDTNGVKLSDKSFSTNNLFKNYITGVNSNCIIQTKDKGFLLNIDNRIVKIDSSLNVIWYKKIENPNSFNISFDKFNSGDYLLSNFRNGFEIIRLDSLGNIDTRNTFYIDNELFFGPAYRLFKFLNHFVVLHYYDNILFESGIKSTLTPFYSQSKLIWIYPTKHKIQGSTFPDFNSNCIFNKPSEFNIPNILIHNKTENTYVITNDSIYTTYLFDRDTAVLKIINIDSNLYVACGKDSIVVDMTGKTDTSGIDFPIRSTKTGSCVRINSFSHSILRPGMWGTYQLNYQNNALDTAYNAHIDIEIDTAKIDSISSPYTFTKIGNILRFQIGNVLPFGTSSITYQIKLRTNVIIGSSICHRSSIFPRCNLFSTPNYDSSTIEMTLRCLPNDTVEVQLMNIGSKNQSDWGLVKSYEDIIILSQDSFKLNAGNLIKFKYKLDTNKVYTAEVFNNNGHPVNPILIRHDDLCANKRAMIPAMSNPALNFSRHDEAREYEEDCDLVRGSYDPNIKSVQPIGMFAQHYTAKGTELKYRIDFQNTGTDTAFRVVLIDTLSPDLDIASFVPGISSHPYYVEFGGRAVKFILDPIILVDSLHNEKLSHGYVCFKIKHKNGIAPKTKIENNADIYFDYNAPVRTNTVFNTIFDTIQIYIPKATDTTGGGSSIENINASTATIYPNPASEKVMIQLSEELKDLNIELFDLSGKMVQRLISQNNQSTELNVSKLQRGLYILRCMSGEKLIISKKLEVR